MSFIETLFPVRISRNAEGGPTWETSVVILRSGYEQRNQPASQPRLHWNVGRAVKSAADRAEVLAWMRAIGGMFHGFRFRDPVDHRAATGVGYLTSDGNGDGTPTAQLYKRYVVGALVSLRPITKPGTVAFFYDGSALTSPAPSLDTTTGIVTWGAFDSENVIAVTPGATTDVELAAALSPNLAIGERLYLSGLTGTIATTLNGIAHTITNVAGAVYTIATTTTGLAWVSGGAGAHYPQATKTLRWSGVFDVPVRFGTDAMRLLAVTDRFQRWDDLPIWEIRV